jgi:phosphohistidine phosphatase
MVELLLFTGLLGFSADSDDPRIGRRFMALFLVQHGKSLSKDQDPDQGLSQEGLADVERMAGVARGYGVRVTVIKHSGKKRARQTAEILTSALKPVKGVDEIGGLNPLDDVTAVATALETMDDIMLVGHLPFMERLTSYLVTGVVDRLVFKFQNGGIVCLDREPDSRFWFIKWTLMPKIG